MTKTTLLVVVAVLSASGFILALAPEGGSGAQQPLDLPPTGDPEITAHATDCLAEQGFDTAGRLAFARAPHYDGIIHWPLVPDDANRLDVLGLMEPTTAAAREATSEGRSGALDICLNELRDTFDAKGDPPQPQLTALDADRRAQLEECIDRADARSGFTSIRHLQDEDGVPVIEGTHPDMPESEIRDLMERVGACVNDIEHR